MYKIGEREFEKYISKEELEEIIHKLATKINADYKGKEVIFVVVLNGAFMFATDLLKQIDLQAKVTFIKVASYENESSSGKIKQLIGLNENLRDKHVIILEDIIDTGFTMASLRKQLLALEPESLEIATLMFKPGKFTQDFPIRYMGMEIEDPFIIGYGFDLNGYGRNLPEIYQLKEK